MKGFGASAPAETLYREFGITADAVAAAHRLVAQFDLRFAQRLALTLQFDREFDDQDRVLGRKPDDGDQADLEIDVIRQPAHVRRDHGAEYP